MSCRWFFTVQPPEGGVMGTTRELSRVGVPRSSIRFGMANGVSPPGPGSARVPSLAKRFLLHQLRFGKSPGTVEDLLARAIQPEQVVPTRGDRQVVRCVLIAA